MTIFEIMKRMDKKFSIIGYGFLFDKIPFTSLDKIHDLLPTNLGLEDLNVA